MKYIQSFLFYSLMATYTVLQFFLIIIAMPFISYDARTKFIVLWSTLYLKLIKIICGVDIEIQGEENIPKNSNTIIISNHQSDLETMFLMEKFQPQATVIKKELLNIPFYGWAFRLITPIPIDRSQKSAALKKILTVGTQRLRDGFWVVIFPEGTRMETHERSSFNPGGAMLGVKSGFPILPIAHNAGVYCPRKSFIKKAGTVTFVIGKPIETLGRKTKDVNKEVETWIHNQLDILDKSSS